jgi:flavin-dependent dehydrogenase
MSKIDVLILGSGLSGSSAAMLLAQKGYQTCIVTPTGATKNHLPENWMVNYPTFISDRGLDKLLNTSFSHHNACTFCSEDGKRVTRITVDSDKENFDSGDVVNVNRDLFDQILLENAVSSGACLVKFDRLLDFRMQADSVRIDLEVDRKAISLEAPYIIDASGKSAFLTNTLKLPSTETKLDHRLASFSHFIPHNGVSLDDMRIISIKNGYIFCIPTFTDRISIGCVLEEDAYQTPEEIFSKGLSQSSYVRYLVENSKQAIPFIPIKNIQRVCLEPYGKHYCIIGDAALFMDPFFCPGIDFAFLSAEQAVSAYQDKNYDRYREFLKTWMSESLLSPYKKLDKSCWKSIIRLFSDPHQPSLIPIFITQALCQLIERPIPLQKGIQLARETYESQIY